MLLLFSCFRIQALHLPTKYYPAFLKNRSPLKNQFETSKTPPGRKSTSNSTESFYKSPIIPAEHKSTLKCENVN